MRNHSIIIKEAAAVETVALATGAKPSAVRSWLYRDSIPAKAWGVFIRNGWATADELIDAAEKKRAA
jgi:hypothetical protein